MTVILWHREDLRISDHPALRAASQTGKKVLPVFILTPDMEKNLGGASRWWLFESLRSLKKEYQKIGGRLIFKKGDPAKVLSALVKTLKGEGVYCTRRFDPVGQKEERSVKRVLKVPLECFSGNHLVDPTELHNRSGQPFAVFAPFWKALQKAYTDRTPLKAPRKIQSPSAASETLEKFCLDPQKDWNREMKKMWKPGREGALKRLQAFKRQGSYQSLRDFPAKEATSMLSPHLHFGEVSPREVWAACRQRPAFLRQLGWREFATAFLYHNPQVVKQNWNLKFNKFPWKSRPTFLKKWQQGKTGYPIIDAAMQQLWKTGWMHNRLRMVVASFLIKDLFIDWRKGAAWFWETLLDADMANNILGWQWVAGSGPDAAPFFRIFNPILQGEKFDPEGKFVKTYLPELKNVPKKWIHKPWLAPEAELAKAKVVLGKSYPHPIVDHEEARKMSLTAYRKIK